MLKKILTKINKTTSAHQLTHNYKAVCMPERPAGFVPRSDQRWSMLNRQPTI